MATLLEQFEAEWSRWADREDDDLEERDLTFYEDRMGTFNTVMWIPHTEQHPQMLARLTEDDVVCDMGAGDLRFAYQAAQKCKKVYAVEFNPSTIGVGLKIIDNQMPRNLIAVCADWRDFPIPEDVNVITVLVNVHIELLPEEWWEHNRKVLYGPTWLDGNIRRIELGESTNPKKNATGVLLEDPK